MNNTQFKVLLGGPVPTPTGLDPLIGQPITITASGKYEQHYRTEYGGMPAFPPTLR